MNKIEKQFLYVELTEMQKDLKVLSAARVARSCQDVKLEHPAATSGTYTIDPNLGSIDDSIKTYCNFEKKIASTCVHNTTSFSQVSYLHLLHTEVSQTIQLPCGAQGPFRLTPFDDDDDVEVKLSKSKDMNVVLSLCNPFSMMREVEFSSSNSVQKVLPFVQPIRHHYQNYFFKDICFN